jgi:predicted TIM-barrel fold metal-dependent hydrolase
MQSISLIQAIDVHAHFGVYFRRELSELANHFMTGSAELVVQRAMLSQTLYTVVSPLKALLPRGEADAFAGNVEAAKVVNRMDGLLQWVVVHPFQLQTFEQARQMVGIGKCVGIKIHPEEHCYSITEHGRVLFELASELQTVVLAHSGDPNSLPSDFVPFANDFPQMNLILAHLGHGGQGHEKGTLQVRAVEESQNGNIYIDTSSAQSLIPGLIEWAVQQIGADRILYGTDTPLYFAPSQRARIDHAEIDDHDKRKILRENAANLLKLSPPEGSHKSNTAFSMVQ